MKCQPLDNGSSAALTGSLSRLDVGKGDALGSDATPVDAALVGRDVYTLGLGPLHEVLDRDTEGSGGEKECRGERFEIEQHRCWVFPAPIPSGFIPGQSIRRIFNRRNGIRGGNNQSRSSCEPGKRGSHLIKNLSRANRVLWVCRALPFPVCATQCEFALTNNSVNENEAKG